MSLLIAALLCFRFLQAFSQREFPIYLKFNGSGARVSSRSMYYYYRCDLKKVLSVFWENERKTYLTCFTLEAKTIIIMYIKFYLRTQVISNEK